MTSHVVELGEPAEKHCEDVHIHERASSITSQESPAERCHTSRQRSICLFLLLGLVVLTQSFDATCICVTLPAIASDLDATLTESMSLGTVFLLATTVGQPIFTELSYVVGRKSAYLTALVIFIAGTVACGCARSTTMLIAGRAIQGIGAGGPQPLGALITTDLFPIRERVRWVAFLNVPWALGTVSGPLLGGLFTQTKTIGWRWVFWVNLPPLGLSLVGAWFLLADEKPPEPFRFRLLVKMDWIGIGLFVTSGGAILTAFSWVGSRFSWASLEVIVPLALGTAGLVLLGAHQTWLAVKPMFRPSLFRRRSTVFQFINITLHGALMWMALYYMSLFYLGVKDLSPLLTGVWALPATLTAAPMAVITGLLVHRTGHYRSFLLLGWALTTLGFFLMTMFKEDTEDRSLIVTTLSLGLALGTLTPGMSSGVQATLTRADAGRSLVMMYLLRAGGQALGVAIGQCVFSSRLCDFLRAYGLDRDAVQSQIRSMRNSLDTTNELDRQRLYAVVEALRAVWFTGGGLAAAALVLAICTRCPPLHRSEEDEDPATEEAKPQG